MRYQLERPYLGMQKVRAIFPLSSFSASTILLKDSDSPPQFHHITRVLRAKCGWEIELLDNSSAKKISGNIINISDSEIEIEVKETSDKDNLTKLHLLLALPEFDVLESVVEKSTEIQISEISIFIPEHTQHKSALERLNSKISRLEKIRNAARIQSGSGPVKLMVNANLKTAITTLPAETGSQLRLVASLESGSTNLHEFLHKYYALEPSAYPTDIILVIGPEGDLSVDEYKLCSSNGFKPVSLGSSTLRVETAAICSAFSINNFFNRE